MWTYIGRRVIIMIPTLFIISIVSFILIQLPPGDYLTTYMARLQESGDQVNMDIIDGLRVRYGLDRPMHEQYLKWIGNFLTGYMGYSFVYNRPVNQLIGDRILLTILISFITLLFTYAVAIPIGIYSATHQYSVGDYAFTFVGFLGLATPNFLLALVFMFLSFRFLDVSVGGLFSPEFIGEPWSWPKIVDLLKHIWVPVVVVGTAGTAGTIRVMRANLLDELRKQYVITARAKGVKETRLLFKYPIRVAINPIVSTVGYILPQLISGATIVSVVLSLPTTGPLLLSALLSQDMYLAGSFVMLLATLTVVGTVLSDILLAFLDPRIRFGGTEA